MSLAPYVATLGRGPGRSRSLTQEEARTAMALILAGEAAPEAVGAMLMLMRMKGETPAEIAGFAQAARAHLPALGATAALDWPCYSAGRSRAAPWFLLAAKLVAQAGHPVLLHGWAPVREDTPQVRDGLGPAGIPVAPAQTLAETLTREGIAFLDLESASPALVDLLRLRAKLGLRSCLNTVVRMLNPAGAPACVQGVFHPAYRDLQAQAGALLGFEALSILKGGGGEFERLPGKTITVQGLRQGQPWSRTAAPLSDDTRRLAEGPRDPERLAALWEGRWHDPYAQDLVLGTATLALDTLGTPDPASAAKTLWANRPRILTHAA